MQTRTSTSSFWRGLAAAAAVALSVGAAVPAHADTFNVLDTKFAVGNGINVLLNNTNYNVYAGALITNYTFTSGASYIAETYCVDIVADVLLGTPVAATQRPTSTFGPSGDGVGWLYNNLATTAGANAFDSAALQLAIWETVYDWNGAENTLGNVNLAGGSFQFTADTALVNRTNQYLTQWSGKKSGAVLYDASDPKIQDMVGKDIPEPATALLLLPAVAIGAVLVRRRK